MEANERTFGVEIETQLPIRHARLFPVGGYHQGRQIPDFPAGWTGESESTIARSGFHAVEIVSPVLKGEDGLTEIVYVVNELARLEASPNEQCGLHVHIGVADLTLDQIKAVRRAFIRYERAFYALSGPDALQRSASGYCKVSDHWRSDVEDRYRSLNLRNARLARHGLSGKNTIEFRMWASTVTDTTVIAAVSMAMALIAKVAAFGAKTFPRIDDEKDAIRAFIHNHFRTRVYQIVPDAPIADIVLHVWHEGKQARHSFTG